MLTISTDLWNGALTNWSPGFQIEYLINIVALFCRQKLLASFLCSLCMVSAGWKSGSLFPKCFSCWGHIPSTDKGSRGTFVFTFLFFFLLPGWHQWWLQDSLAESLWQWLTKSRKIMKWLQRGNYIFQAPLHLHIENLCTDPSQGENDQTEDIQSSLRARLLSAH